MDFLTHRAPGEDPLGRGRFDDLVRRHERRILAIAYQICGNLEDARDVAQEAFLRAFQYRRGFRRDQRLASWLNRIAVNAALDLIRKRTRGDALRRGEVAHQGRLEAVPEPSPEDRLRSRQEERKLFSLLNLLAPRERAAFVLRYLQGLSTSEVARSMGCTRVTVRRHATRARAKLRQALGGHQGAPGVREALDPAPAGPITAPATGKK